MYDFIVVGKGLFGASAFRYLSLISVNGAVIGPDEPLETTNQQGVFGAHYDEGRLTYQLKSDVVWANLAVKSLARFPKIQANSGIEFHTPAGNLYLATESEGDSRFRAANLIERDAGEYIGINFEKLNEVDIKNKFPYLNIPGDYNGLWESAPAGYFSPRLFIQAQLALAGNTAQIKDIVTGIEVKEGEVWVRTRESGRFTARKVLVAAGAYSNNFSLMERPLALTLKQEYVIMAELSGINVERLTKMPPIVFRIKHPRLADLYILPPIKYPDGRYYLKMGANTALDQFVETEEEINDWYRTGNSDAMLPEMRQMVLSLFPGLRADGWHTHRCVITRTIHKRPYIDEVVPGQVYVAVGGNGQGAKAADEIGRLAAHMVLEGKSAGREFAAVFK